MPAVRNSISSWFNNHRPVRLVGWAAVPLVCLALPGPGVIIAGLWVLVLMVLAKQPWSLLGVRRPQSAVRLLAAALGLAVVLTLLATYVLDPTAQSLTAAAPAVAIFSNENGDWGKLLLLLAISWVVGATIEEVVFRGFMIGFGIHLFGARSAWLLAIMSAIVFGVSHLYQGASGVLLTGMLGFLLAAVYILSKRNLPLVMLIHGFIDSIAMLQEFFHIH